MQRHDLGELSGQVMLFGGPYSNLAALKALMAEAEQRGIPANRCICTGDIVAYGAEAAECVALVRSAGFPVVAGNCERQLGAGAGNCGCGFADGSACDIASGTWYAHAMCTLGAGDCQWMAGLPGVLTFRHAGQACAVIHGGASDIARFLWPVSTNAEFAEEIELLTAMAGPLNRVIAGHCGMAFSRRVGGVEWINAGVIGMPPNDGTPETRFAVLDSEGRLQIEHLAYDPAPSVAAMKAAGLVQGYEDALLSGWWPSEDILPESVRRDHLRASG